MMSNMVRLATRLDAIGEHNTADRVDGMIRDASWLKPVTRYLDDATQGIARWMKGSRAFHTIDPKLANFGDQRIAKELQKLPPGMLERGNPQEIMDHIHRLAVSSWNPSGRRSPYGFSKTWHELMRGNTHPITKLEQRLNTNWVRQPGAWGMTPQYAQSYGIPALATGGGLYAGSRMLNHDKNETDPSTDSHIDPIRAMSPNRYQSIV